MALGAFYSESTRVRAVEAVRAIEAQSCAEVVVTLRHASEGYRHVDFGLGAALAWLTLGTMLYAPPEFSTWSLLVAPLMAFAVAQVVAPRWPGLRRALSSRKLREDAVRRAARAAFVEQGISRTRARSGLLVFLSVLERQAEIVLDVGLDLAVLGAPWAERVRSLQDAFARGDVDGFDAAMRALGPILAKHYPRGPDDVNELPDEVDVR